MFYFRIGTWLGFCLEKKTVADVNTYDVVRFFVSFTKETVQLTFFEKGLRNYPRNAHRYENLKSFIP